LIGYNYHICVLLVDIYKLTWRTKEAEETVVDLSDEERLYRKAKLRNEREETRLYDDEEALKQWKQDHGDDNDRYRFLS
jgi:hypothetical protein